MNLASGESRARRDRELALDIVRVVEQHAARRRPVTAGAARLLEIILQGPWDVSVNDEAHVWLVNPHAEGVGCRDGTQFAFNEATLDVLLRLRLQPSVIMLSPDSL